MEIAPFSTIGFDNPIVLSLDTDWSPRQPIFLIRILSLQPVDFQQDKQIMSCLTKGLIQTEEPQYKKSPSATIDAPSVLTETIDAQYEGGWVT